MTGWLLELGPEGTALALLVVGHVLADFTFQTDALARNKHRLGALLSHGAIVIAVHVAAFVPLLTLRTAVVLLGVGVAHVLVDAVSARLRNPASPSAARFLGDQFLHGLVLLGAWSLIGSSAWTEAPAVVALGGSDRIPWADITRGAIYLSAFGFAREGGNTIVRGILPDRSPESEGTDLEAGSLIGTLERWIVLLLGVAGQWGSVGLVIAAKSIARYQELKRRPFAEYFLVGTLASVLVAIVLVVLVTVVV